MGPSAETEDPPPPPRPSTPEEGMRADLPSGAIPPWATTCGGPSTSHPGVADTTDTLSAAEVQSVRLVAYLGERSLFAFSSRLRVVNTHFLSLGSDPARTLAALGPLPPDVHGTLLRSHPVSGTLPRIARDGDNLRYVRQQYERHYVDLSGTFDEYLGRFSSKSRSTLKRKVRKFAESNGGQLDWRKYHTPEELREFYPLARAVSKKTYQEKLLGSGLPETEQFRQRLDSEEAYGYLLMEGEKPVAYVFCPCRDGVLQYEYVGHDPEYNALSPGTVLQYVILEDLFGSKVARFFDFTEGEGQHKSAFSTHSVPCADLYYFRRSLRNLCVVRIHAAVDTMSRKAGALLDRIGLKAKLKRWLRRHG